MQEIKKSRIVIASVLKPIDDTRMYEKMGLTLSSMNNAEVHIIGYPSERSPASDTIQFHPLKKFSRLSIRRVTAAWSIALKFIRLRPTTIIVTTHELLLAAVITKFIRGSRVIYDVRENYYRNIIHTNSFPFLLRHFVAWHVRFKEVIAGMFADHFILAERGYEGEMRFIHPRKKTVIENKVKRPDFLVQHTNRKISGSNFLFSGTLAETTGVFDAIDLAERLHESDPSIRLTIVGYAAREDVRNKLREATNDKAYIRLAGIDRLVPHTEIIKQIQQADAGIIAYPPNKSTESSIPTKLYEYLGLTLPVILVNHAPWVKICKQWNAAVVIPTGDFDVPEFLHKLRRAVFYPEIPEDVFWDDEESKLKKLISGQN